MDLNAILEAQVAADADERAPAAEEPIPSAPPWWGGLLAAAAWLGAAGLTAAWPDADEFDRTAALAFAMSVIGVGVAVAAALHIAPRARDGALLVRLRQLAPWLIALAVLLGTWEVISAKLDLLPRPFFAAPQALLEVFAAPQALLEVFTDDWKRLGESVLRSLLLLLPAYLIGAVVGFLTGVAVGWSRPVGYWVHPVLRLIGPLPAVAWLPLAFFAFPSSGSASTFLIALATFFPVAVLTWSGVAGVAGPAGRRLQRFGDGGNAGNDCGRDGGMAARRRLRRVQYHVPVCARRAR